MAMLEVKNLEVYYGVIQAIKGISFEVNEGEVIALIGANGAGKTTTLQTITGMLQPKAGEIIFEGKDISKIPGHKIVSMGMAHVPEGRRVFAELSVFVIFQPLQHFHRIMVTYKCNGQFRCWYLIYVTCFGFIETGISVYFVKIINIQFVIR